MEKGLWHFYWVRKHRVATCLFPVFFGEERCGFRSGLITNRRQFVSLEDLSVHHLSHTE